VILCNSNASVCDRQPNMKVMSEELRRFAAAGVSIKEPASKLGVSYSTVFLRAKREGIAFKRPPSTKSKVNDPVRKEMAVRYRNGATLQQIGDHYGITRERVRQILSQHYGIDGRHGGQHVTARRRSISTASNRDTKYLAKYGCSFAQFKELLEIGRTLMSEGEPRARTPVGAFRQQRHNARQCGYVWNFTLWQWWTIWQKSGHWNERGRGHGYWMTRRDKSGPFSVENVFIAPGEDSWSEVPPDYHRGRPRAGVRGSPPHRT